MFDLELIIRTGGLIGLFFIVFAESGLFIGFFLPGDSLLFTAGFLASQGYINIWTLVPLAFIAAVLGDSVGYYFGKKVGPLLFTRDDSIFFHKDHLQRAEIFYEKYGPKAIVLARFMPIVRTFAPIVAGVGNMNYRTFLTYNILGALLWGAGIPLLGFYLGNSIPGIDTYLIPIVIFIIIVTSAPAFYHILREYLRQRSSNTH